MAKERTILITVSADGAQAILNLVPLQELKNTTDLFFDQLRPARAHEQAYDPAARQQLRLLSFELTGLPVV